MQTADSAESAGSAELAESASAEPHYSLRSLIVALDSTKTLGIRGKYPKQGRREGGHIRPYCIITCHILSAIDS